MKKGNQQQLSTYKYIEDIQKFRRNLEKADLLISHKIDHGFVLYGETKVGKTSTAHLLSGNVLSGVKIDGEEYLINLETNKYQEAKIGNHLNSQTQLPNIFNVKLKTEKLQIALIDTPGYGDNNGIFSLISNGYYHYKLCEKIKSMKFIICIERPNIDGPAKTLFNTLSQFTSLFRYYPQGKQSIWNSCALLITKVPESETPQQTQNDLEAKLNKIISGAKTNFPQAEDKVMKQMLNFLIRTKRVFYIKKYKNKEKAEDSSMLQNINNAVTNWWARKQDKKKGIIDMNPIRLSIIKKIDYQAKRSEKTKQEFKELIRYYNNLTKQFRPINIAQSNTSGTICQVLTQIMSDSMKNEPSHQFLKLMENYIKKFYPIFEKNLEAKRKQIQKQLFSVDIVKNQTNGKIDQNDFHYLIKKFNFIEKSFEIYHNEGVIENNQYDKEGYRQKSEQKIQSYKNILISIFKLFNFICYEFKNLQEIIYKYNYTIYRLFQECKIFYHLMEQQMIAEQTIDIFVPMKEFLNWEPKYEDTNPYKIKERFLTSYDPSEQDLQNLVVDEIVIKFFTDSQSSQACKSCHRLQLVITKLVIRYSLQILQEQQIQDCEIFNTLISRLSIYIKNCYNVYLKGQKKQKQQATTLIRKASDQLGKMLVKLNQKSKAISVYKSINCISQVKKLYENLISQADRKKTRNKYPKESVSLRIQYGKYLQKHFMQEKAIMMLQDAYDMSQSFDDIENTAKLIKHYLSQKEKKLLPQTYHKQLCNNTYFEPLPEKLQKQLYDYHLKVV